MMAKAESGGHRPGMRWRTAAWGTAAMVLLLPLVAMQFTDEVNWDLTDFIVASVLVGSVGILFELAVRWTPSRSYRVATGLALAGAFLLIWINLAVGIIGSEDNPANLMFFGVLGVGVLGALLARFKPRGMAIALAATAVAQTSVAAIALFAGLGFIGPITVFFAALWLLSARLFRKAERE